MTLEARIARLFAMDEETWARHANPWSVYSRFTALPFLLLALWSHAWFGWGMLLPLALALAWIWFNPRSCRLCFVPRRIRSPMHAR